MQKKRFWGNFVLHFNYKMRNVIRRIKTAGPKFFFFIFGLHGPQENLGWFVPMCSIKKVN